MREQTKYLKVLVKKALKSACKGGMPNYRQGGVIEWITSSTLALFNGHCQFMIYCLRKILLLKRNKCWKILSADWDSSQSLVTSNIWLVEKLFLYCRRFKVKMLKRMGKTGKNGLPLFNQSIRLAERQTASPLSAKNRWTVKESPFPIKETAILFYRPD